MAYGAELARLHIMLMWIQNEETSGLDKSLWKWKNRNFVCTLDSSVSLPARNIVPMDPGRPFSSFDERAGIFHLSESRCSAFLAHELDGTWKNFQLSRKASRNLSINFKRACICTSRHIKLHRATPKGHGLGVLDMLSTVDCPCVCNEIQSSKPCREVSGTRIKSTACYAQISAPSARLQSGQPAQASPESTARNYENENEFPNLE